MFTGLFQQYFSAYKGLAKELWVLGWLTLINRMGTMVLPFLSIYLNQELHFDLSIAGILIGAFGFGSLVGTYTGGRLVDSYGPRFIIIFSLMFGGVLLALLPLFTGFYGLFIMIFLAAAFGEAYRPAMTAAVGLYAPADQMGRSTAFLRLAINLGMSISPAIGGFIVVYYSYNGLFWIDGFTCILGAFYFMMASAKWEQNSKELEEKTETNAVNQAMRPYQDKAFLLFLLSTFFLGLGFVQWFHSVPLFIKDSWGYDERFVGIIMGFSCLLIVLVEMPLIHRIEVKKLSKKAVKLGILLVALSFFPFLGPASLILAFLAVIIFTIGEILVLPFNTAIALELSPAAKRGEYMAWYWMTWSFSSIFAPSIGLGVADAFGFNALWFVAAALLLISLAIIYSVEKPTKIALKETVSS